MRPGNVKCITARRATFRKDPPMDTEARAVVNLSQRPCKFALTMRGDGIRLNLVNDVKIARLEKQRNAIRRRLYVNEPSVSKSFQFFDAAKHRLVSWALLPLALIAAGMLAGCETQSLSPADAAKQSAVNTAAETNELISLREGDVVKIAFPGSPTFDTTQQIRRDGRITLLLIGDVDVVGLTPAELEARLLDLYASQLSSKQVSVAVVSSLIPVYVTGAVRSPGKIMSDHPLTALGAVMEAGGFDINNANSKDVVVIRREGNIMKSYRLNLKAVLQGKQVEPFFLKPYDIVNVPQRFSMF